jgi:6-phosphogluconolactonase (cycloisomerase 2 family)
LLLVGLTLLALAAMAGSAQAAPLLKPGAVFTQTNNVPNEVVAYNRAASGHLTFAGKFATGGNGQPVGNPPTAFTVLDSAGSVGLSDDGDNNSCLFVVNAGSDGVSSFRVRPDGLQLAAQNVSSGGDRPVSVTSTTRGPGKQVLYVLNSQAAPSGPNHASIQGYYVNASCGLTMIPGSFQLTPSQESIPAAIRFDEHGRFMTVSQRYANGGFPVGNGDLITYPVDKNGVAGPPITNESAGRTPYGLDYNHQDILSVTNETFEDLPIPNSTVTTYQQTKTGELVPLDTEPSPGAACWNLFTNNGKFLYVTNPAGGVIGSGNVRAYSVDRNGEMTFVDQENTPFESIDNALSHNSQYLYVLSTTVVSPGPASAITAFAIDQKTGALTRIEDEPVPENLNSTSGLAAW